MNQQTEIWLPAWMAATRYVAHSMVMFASGWLANLGREGFNSVEAYDWCVLIIGSLGAGLVGLGAIMNGSWHTARSKTNGHHEQEKSE